MAHIIYLVGFMGAGKTTLAKQVAAEYGYHCVDTDTVIEQKQGNTIAEIFDTLGEEKFRQIEAETIRKIDLSQNTIISTGGGLPCFHNNMEWMNKNGITVYLKHSVEGLKKRLENEQETRPVLKNNKNLTLLSHIEGLMRHRSPYYEQAKFVISSSLISPQTIINTTIKQC